MWGKCSPDGGADVPPRHLHGTFVCGATRAGWLGRSPPQGGPMRPVDREPPEGSKRPVAASRQRVASRWQPATATAPAYAAAVVAFAYAGVSLYWAFGGTLLVSTIGGTVEGIAHRGGPAAVLLALAAAAVKAAVGLLALALVRPCGRMMPRRWRLLCSATASAILVCYGGTLVAAGALVLSGAISPASADRNVLRWHVAVWDMWFLLWGLLLGAAAVAFWRRPR